MILVTLGTQDKKFYRLLDAVAKEIEDGNIKDEVIVQAGCCADYKSNRMKIIDSISKDEFNELVKRSDLIITHGGVGSIIDGLKNDKKVIAVPRLSKYGEAANDHQIQIIECFANDGYILPLLDFDKFQEVLIKSKKFVPKKYKSNRAKFTNIVENLIDNYLK